MLLNAIRSLSNPAFILAMFVFGMIGWLLVYAAVFFASVLSKGVVRQNVALRHEISVLRRELGKRPGPRSARRNSP